jgi:ESCRT-II complex subunit VPS22
MSSRRGVGLSAFQNRSSLSSQYATHGASLRNKHVDSLQTQLSVFQSLLHNFALQHGDTIKSNPTFRAEFARMCNAIGVDPLAGSNVKGKNGKGGKGSWWAQMLDGDVNDFYFELAVRVVEVCRGSRGENGGLIGVEECRERVGKGRGIGGGIDVSEYVEPLSAVDQEEKTQRKAYEVSDDIIRAVKSLKPLGSGFSVVTVGSKQMIRSIPKELNTDQSTVLEAIQILGYVTCSMLEDNLGWDYARAETVIQDLLADSLVWVDAQAPEKEYWSPVTMNDPED